MKDVNYWNGRYISGGNSGNGSYGKLANEKNNIVNNIVEKNNIQSVCELGCGDGNYLINSKYSKYVGYDISKRAIELCEEKIKNKDYHFYVQDKDTKIEKAELFLSLEVLFHITNQSDYFNYINNLFNNSTKYVIIQAFNGSNHDMLRKHNINAPHHCFFREFTKYIDTKFNDWALLEIIKSEFPFGKHNKKGIFSDFYVYEKIKH